MSDSANSVAGPRAVIIGHHLPVVVLACAGIALSLTLFVVVGRWDATRTRTEFERAAVARVAALHDSIDANLLEVEALGSLFAASDKVERKGFRGFVTPFLKERGDIQALEWIPRVTDDQRARYEAAARADGWRGFRITERQTKGHMVAAARRPEYFPVYYLEPYQGNEIALGFDLASNPVRRAAIERSRDTGRTLATARITLVQETANQSGVLVFVPVYRQGGTLTTVAERRQHLRGFALGVFRIGDMLHKAAARTQPEGVDLHLFDDSAPAADRFLAYYPARARTRPLTVKQAYSWRGLRYSATIPVAGRKWWVLCTPTPEYLAARKTWQPWGALLAGLLLTGVMSAYLSLVMRSAERARRSAAELVQAKQTLEREAAERAQTQEALRASETRHGMLLEALPQRVFYKDANLAYLYCNPSYATDLGIAPGEIVGKTDYDFYPDELASKYQADDQRIMQSGEIEEIEERYTQGGREFVVHTVKTPIRDEQGSVEGILGIFWDVTERQQAEARLRESEQKYRLLFENLNDAALMADVESGVILEANKQAEALLGRTRDEIVGMHQTQLHPPGAAERYRTKFDAHVRAGQMTDYDGEVVRKDGRLVPVVISASVQEIAGRQIILGLFRDISERKQAEQALYDQETKYRLLFENLNDAAMLADAETGLILEVNKQAEALLGRTREEIVGMHQTQLHPPGTAEEYRAKFERHVRVRGAVDYDGELLRKDGSLVPVATSSSVQEIAGRQIILGLFRDMSERKRAEEALQFKNRELESFVYTVSHDLRTPLVSLEGFARILADEYSERLDAEGQHYLARLRANVQTMDSLLADLLALSRVGRAEEPLQEVPAGEVVAAALDNLAALVDHSGAVVKVANDLPTVRYSRPRLFQVFSNLISNAIKFSRPGEIPQVEVGAEQLPSAYRFFVKDNGIGIAEGHQQQVFEIFRRLRQKEVEGAGIGLAIVKRIVENHGGAVGVDSIPGAGSTFWFTVPRQPVATEGGNISEQ